MIIIAIITGIIDILFGLIVLTNMFPETVKNIKFIQTINIWINNNEKFAFVNGMILFTITMIIMNYALNHA